MVEENQRQKMAQSMGLRFTLFGGVDAGKVKCGSQAHNSVGFELDPVRKETIHHQLRICR
jgi:hypothetical protein